MIKRLLAGATGATVLFGCTTGNFSEVATRGGWRAEAERACMARRAGAEDTPTNTPTVAAGSSAGQADKPLVGPSIVELPPIIEDACGIDHPLRISALVDGQTAFDPPITLGCPLTEALDSWLRESVQPAALEWIGAPVTEIDEMTDYACRRRNVIGLGYSEHAFGNALDITAFRFANGERLTVVKDWNGSAKAGSFFREIFATACQRFTTVLGPGSNILHYNHIHVDLAIIAPDKSPKLCDPWPEVTPPQRAPIGGEQISASRVGVGAPVASEAAEASSPDGIATKAPGPD